MKKLSKIKPPLDNFVRHEHAEFGAIKTLQVNQNYIGTGTYIQIIL